MPTRINVMELSTWNTEDTVALYAQLDAPRKLKEYLDGDVSYFESKLKRDKDLFPLTYQHMYAAFRPSKAKDALRQTLASDTAALVQNATRTLMQPKTLHGAALPLDLGACSAALEALVTQKAEELAQTRHALRVVEGFQRLAAMAQELERPPPAKRPKTAVA
jgi:hypothetical protein